MKFPESWLHDFVTTPVHGEQLAHVLTMAGLESEELTPVAPPFSNVVVACVLSVIRHPDADRLNVCQVDVGDGVQRQIVCGAPNVAVGMTVPCALPDAVLPGDFRIKVTKVRGVESFGMLCSAKELGLSGDASGLLSLASELKAGTDLREALQLDDLVHVLKLTPNRGDCLSILGVAREVSALTGGHFLLPDIPPVSMTADLTRDVVIDSPSACSGYLGRIIAGVDSKAPTPFWMIQRLERAGLRSISALVDITNYVMLELGQPLHAFDNALLNGTVRVRMARQGDCLLLLNGQSIELGSDVLVIADEVKVLAMAGIMGGEESGITLETRDVFLESACFMPKAIAGRARRYGFGSDASHRYERGVDFHGMRRAIERASQLILSICGGRACPVVEAFGAEPVRVPVTLRLSRLCRVVGVDFNANEVMALFKRLNLPTKIIEGSGDGGTRFEVTPPSYRFDLEIEADLVEEVARIYGYDNIPLKPPMAITSMLPQTERSRSRSVIRSNLVSQGYQEVVNFSFVDEAWENDFAGQPSPIRLANPIASQMGVMRSSLLGGLVSNLVTNQRRKQSQVRLFELGRCFSADPSALPVAGYRQPWKVAGLAWGTTEPEQWGETARRVDFFDAKGDVEALLGDVPVNFSRSSHPSMHPGRSADIFLGEKHIGMVGELHPRWVQKYELTHAPVIFEMDLEFLLVARFPVFCELSNQPVVVRDLALVVDQSVSLQTLLDAMKDHQPKFVKEIGLFDLYLGKGVPVGKKSLAFRVVMQDTQKTLQDADVDMAIQNWVAELGNSVGAQLRV